MSSNNQSVCRILTFPAVFERSQRLDGQNLDVRTYEIKKCYYSAPLLYLLGFQGRSRYIWTWRSCFCYPFQRKTAILDENIRKTYPINFLALDQDFWHQTRILKTRPGLLALDQNMLALGQEIQLYYSYSIATYSCNIAIIQLYTVIMQLYIAITQLYISVIQLYYSYIQLYIAI